MFEKQAYLQRIHLKQEIAASLDGLRALHHAHLSAIPFENFDVLLGRKISLKPQDLFHKLVEKQRGGYCYEVNGLFLMALQAFGFEARALLGRVHLSGTPTGREHQLSLITLDEKLWIADVGFGGKTPPEPMPLIVDQPIAFADQTMRLMESQAFGFMLQSRGQEGWEDLYSFDLSYVCQGDIDQGNFFSSTAPDTFLSTERIATLQTKWGVMTLLNHTLKKREQGGEQVIELQDGPGYIKALEEHFSIKLDATCAEFSPRTL
uniref:Putative N-hydroxyarylamine O-acetyltransferase n=1 Tax=Magnetococcus massalia (strain MO-1) TaxID=451514 RepID=A0A1S7LHH9_MAGMO|nr:putative N-hydroxyarylamine O-acetyltransferase [Candidatus Magnetococcus massalia]